MDINRFRPEINRGLILRVHIMEKHTFPAISDFAIPGKGQENHRILKSLAGMYRNDAHTILVTLKT